MSSSFINQNFIDRYLDQNRFFSAAKIQATNILNVKCLIYSPSITFNSQINDFSISKKEIVVKEPKKNLNKINLIKLFKSLFCHRN